MQVPIILAGKTHTLVARFDALDQVERGLDCTITTLAEKLLEGELALREIVIILSYCLVPSVSVQLLEEQIFNSGFPHITQAIAQLFANVFAVWDGGSPVQTINMSDTLHQMMDVYPDA